MKFDSPMLLLSFLINIPRLAKLAAVTKPLTSWNATVERATGVKAALMNENRCFAWDIRSYAADLPSPNCSGSVHDIWLQKIITPFRFCHIVLPSRSLLMDEVYVSPTTHQRWSRTQRGIYQHDRQAECNAGIFLQRYHVFLLVVLGCQPHIYLPIYLLSYLSTS